MGKHIISISKPLYKIVQYCQIKEIYGSICTKIQCKINKLDKKYKSS